MGLRTEYTDWTFDSKSTNTYHKDNYISWMPTLHLKYTLATKHTFSASYSRRISRPWYSQLNPFMSWYDSTSTSSGNPELEASYYNSYQAEYMLFTANTSVTTRFYFRNTDNATEYYYETTPWGITSKPINIAKNQAMGTSLSLMQTITKWWNFNAFFSIANSMYDAPLVGINNRQQTRWSANFNTTIKPLEKLRIQISGYYSSSGIKLQGKDADYYSMSTGLNYDFLNDKMSVNLSCNNLIYQANNENMTFGEYFISYSKYNWQRRSFSLGISYKINDYKSKQDRIDEDGSSGGQGGSGMGGV